MNVRVTIPGEPVSKARPRVVGTGSSRRTYTPVKTAAAENAIGWVLRAAGVNEPDREGAYKVEVAFYCGTWRHNDIDNLTKLVLDACNGVVWADDSQVYELHAYVIRGASDPHTGLTITRTGSAGKPKGTHA